MKKSNAKAATKTLTKSPTVKKPTVKEHLVNLRAAIINYFSSVRYQQPDPFYITLQATTPDGKDGVLRVSSILAAVTTAQGLGKQVRLEVSPNDKGGTLYVRFYSPVKRPELLEGL